MSSRLIALILFVLAGSALAQTETTTGAVKQAASEAVEQVEKTVEKAEEMTKSAGEDAENLVDEATQTIESETENAEQAVESTNDSAEQAVESAVEKTENKVEKATQTVESETENVEQPADTAESKQNNDTEVTTIETKDGIEVVDVDEPSEIAKEAAAMDMDGATIDQDIQAKIAACAACHGADGNSVIPQNPKLAGQVPGFIADQLSKFKSGERDNAIMTAQVANLSDEDMEAIDRFYSSQQPQLGAISEEMQEMALIGEKIFRGGEPSMSISACMSCHGPSGHGIPTRFPKVSGQHIEYLEATLLAYKSGSRASDVMNPIAFKLSEQQIKALAIYMHGLK